ncbi:MAG: hypothetical protein RSB77_01980 [Bacilli bacterium]
MDAIFPQKLIELLTISVTLSFIVMALIQKVKKLSFINKKIYIWIVNMIASFGLAIPFGIVFYNTTYLDGLWIGLFTFIGAPTLYETLKNQNIITYRPNSLSDTITVDKKNEIKTDF